MTACLGPRESEKRPAQTRDTIEAANWKPVTSPTINVLCRRVSWTWSGMTGIAKPMTKKAANTDAMMGKRFRAPCGSKADSGWSAKVWVHAVMPQDMAQGPAVIYPGKSVRTYELQR